MAKVNNHDLKQLIIEDLEEKKPYPAKWDLSCGLCDNDIPAGDDFFYLGGKKVCNDCRDLATQLVNERL